MPRVRQAVQDFFKKEPRKDVNPDEAVAVGAALQGAVLSGDVKDILLLDVTPLSLGIETMGGVMTKLIEKNTTIPTRKSQIFSTADDNQTTVTIRVFQGEREIAVKNKLLGKFDLADIPSAPRGMPQIEVSFDIDSNGILNVSAQDKASGKKQSIIVKASSGLSEKEIQDMVEDARKNEEEDKKFQELIHSRNAADGILHTVQRTLKDLGDKIDSNEKESLEKAVAQLKEVLDKDDKAIIEERAEHLSSLYAALTEKFGQAGQNEATAGSATHNDDEIIDAEFDEVDKR
jgi:molecular chaperone DnaK